MVARLLFVDQIFLRLSGMMCFYYYLLEYKRFYDQNDTVCHDVAQLPYPGYLGYPAYPVKFYTEVMR